MADPEPLAAASPIARSRLRGVALEAGDAYIAGYGRFEADTMLRELPTS
jgi:hypothetical protein